MKKSVYYAKLLFFTCLSFLVFMSVANATYSQYVVEGNIDGEIITLTETKTPYNTILIDSKSKDILLWSFDIGGYAGKLSAQTSVLNLIFSIHDLLLATNKKEIIELIKGNEKYHNALKYYREYLNIRDEKYLNYVERYKDSLILDLLEYNKTNNFFKFDEDEVRKLLKIKTRTVQNRDTLYGEFEFQYETSNNTIVIKNPRALAYGLLPQDKLINLKNGKYAGSEYFMKAFMLTSIVDPTIGLLSQWFIQKNTIMGVANFDSDLKAKMDIKEVYKGEYGLYTDLAMSPISISTIINYANIISIVLDMKLGKTSKSPKKWYHGFIINEKKLEEITKWFDRAEASLTILETVFYFWPDNEKAELAANQFIGNTKALLNSVKKILVTFKPKEIEEFDPNGKYGITEESIADKSVESIKQNMPFWGLILSSADFQTNLNTQDLKEIICRILYRYLVAQEKNIKDILSENEFVGITTRMENRKKSFTDYDKKMVLKIQNIFKSTIAMHSIKKALYADMPRAIEIIFGNFNAFANIMNSLTNEQNVFEATIFLIRQYLTAQIQEMVSELGTNGAELLAKQLSAKIRKSLVPGANTISLALTGSDLVSFAKDFACSPKYVPFTVNYKFDTVNQKHNLVFSEPESCNFSQFSYLYDVPDEDLSDNAQRVYLSELILDNDLYKDPYDGYLVREKKEILMRSVDTDAFFYHDFYLGENIDKTLFESKIRQNSTVKVGIYVNTTEKGKLISDINLPREEMDADEYIDTIDVDGQEYAVIDCGEMFYNSQNNFFQRMTGIKENRTYYRLKGNDIYSLTTIIEFTDFKGHQGGIDGSIFRDTISVYMPHKLSKQEIIIKLIKYDNAYDVMRLDIRNYSHHKLHVYLYNKSNTVMCLDNKKYINNSSFEWVKNSILDGKILLVDDILHEYLQKRYSGNEANIAKAFDRIIEKQGNEQYVLMYAQNDIAQSIDIFDFDDQENLALEQRFDENGDPCDDVEKYGDELNATFQGFSQLIAVGKNASGSITLSATGTSYTNLTFIITSQPSHGILTLDENVAKYMPNTDFMGNDFFTYIANDGTEDSETGMISIVVTTIIDGLVAYYPFDGNANDMSGKGNNGTASGDVEYVDGIIGKAAKFDGVDDYISIKDSESLDTDYAMTLSVWIKPSEFNTEGSKVIGKWYSSGSGGEGDWLLSLLNETINGKSNLIFVVANYPKGWVDSITMPDKNIEKNKWVNIITTFDNGYMRLYIDNVLISEKNSQVQYTSKSEYSTDDIFIGQLWNHHDPYDYKGLIDDIRIYNRPLTETEIQALYQMGGNISPPLTFLSFVSESPQDYSYQPDSFEKEWQFKSYQNISDLKAEIINSDFSSNGTAKISEKDENGLFSVQIELTPDTSKAINKIHLQFKDKNDEIVKVNNSDKFWSIIRTNHLPEIDPAETLQLVGQSGAMLEKEILAFDKDDDELIFSVIEDYGIFEGNIINVQFDSDGVHTIQIRISDGKEFITTELNILTYGENGGIKEFYSDVSLDHPYYNEIMFDTLMNAVWGDVDPNDNTKRLFNPEMEVNWAESLKMVLKSAAIRGLIELPTSGFLVPTEYEKDWYWAKPYYTFARNKQAISTNIKFSGIPTREEIAKLISMCLDLSILPEFENLSSLEFNDKDKDDFTNDIMLEYAMTTRLFNLFMTEDNVKPKEKVKRGELAKAISLILRMPTGEIDSGASVELGDNLKINGIKNLKASAIMSLGDGIIKEEWIDSPADYVKASIAVNKDVVVNDSMIKDLEPVNVDTISYQIGTNRIIAIIQNTKGRARNILTNEFDVSFSDQDFDGTQDRKDSWENDSRYAYDENNNGIPDILDIIYDLDKLTTDDSLTVGGTKITVGKIIEDGEINDYYDVCVPVIVYAKNSEMGECQAFPTPCHMPEGWIPCAVYEDIDGNESVNLLDAVIGLKVIAGMETNAIHPNKKIGMEDVISVLKFVTEDRQQ